LLAVLGCQSCYAHAELERTEPQVGSTVRIAPTEVAVWFTQKLEPALSTITVRNAAGQRVDVGGTRVSGNVMRVPVKALAAGTYRVNWRVLSVDTHRTQGSFTFRVGE
jgi:methionine-rich copper-binding protein CopC